MESPSSDRVNTTVIESSGMRGPGYPGPGVNVDVTEISPRDRVRWGPIIAGVVSAFAVLLFLTTVGIALGLSALGGDNDTSSWGTTAGIYGAITLLLAFFVGGWVAARAASPTPEPNGILNGFLTGAAILLLLLWMATTAITGALGFFAGTVTDIAGAAGGVASTAIETVDPAAVQEAVPAIEENVPGAEEAVQDAEQTAEEAAENPEAVVNEVTEEIDAVIPDDPGAVAAEVASEDVAPGAWGTAIAMVLAVAAAALGGMVGQNQGTRVAGSRTVVSS